MSDIENHEVDPRLSTVLALAHALHLDLGVLNVLPAPSRRRARKISH